MGLERIPSASRLMAVEEVLGDLMLLLSKEEPSLRPKLLAMMSDCAKSMREIEEPDAADAIDIMRESFKRS